MIVFLLIKLLRFSYSLFSPCYLLDYSGYKSTSVVDPSWNSPTSFTTSNQGTDEEALSDTEYYQQKKVFAPLTNGHSMTNGHVQYNQSERSRSCENSLDSYGRKSADELTISSSSLIDLPISPPSISRADYDNLATVNGHHDTNGQTITTATTAAAATTTTHQSITKSPISSELDKKTKDAIDARLKDIDDEFELNCKKKFFYLFFIYIIELDEKCFFYLLIIIFHSSSDFGNSQ